MTMVFGPGMTRGPSPAPASPVTMPMPVNPVSDEPIASVTIVLGSVSTYCCFTAGENSAALLEMANSDDASGLRRRYDSMSGRAIASPMSTMTLTPRRCTTRQTSSGSNRLVSTTVSPPNSSASAAHCALPWMSGARHSRTIPPISWPRLTCAHSSGTGMPVMKSMPPPSTRHTSSCRHSTPFGYPVVPPV